MCLGDGSVHNGGDCAVAALLTAQCLLRAVDVGVCDVCMAELGDYVVGSLADTVAGSGLAKCVVMRYRVARTSRRCRCTPAAG